jgi:hypothetical protein
VLWSLIGGPFEGKYRNGSVVHDYYCDVRSANWRSVHKMFYRAMLVSGVSVRRAKVMYAAVYFAGPRWNDTVVENVRLGPPAVPTRPVEDNRIFYTPDDPTTLAVSEVIERGGQSALAWFASGRLTPDPSSEITLRLDKLSEMVERDDPSLRSLEAAIERAVRFIPDAESSPRSISVGSLATLS